MASSVKRSGQGVLLCAAALSGLLAATLPLAASAFGLDAHRVVGFIAEDQVCPQTRTGVRRLMGRFELARAGVWADRIRSQPQWDKARPWHYINVPDGVPVREARRAKGGDVLSAIKRFSRELRDEDRPPGQRQEALNFLVHFVADLHQPLHVGRQSDLGGNRVNVRVGDRVSNLHRYWDSLVLLPALDNPRAYARRLLAELDPQAAAGWRELDPYAWAEESMALRPAVYDFMRPERSMEPVVLDAVYQGRALEIIDQRLLQAGIRVAASLDAVFCNP